MDESGVATPPEDTTTSRGTLASRHARATFTTPVESHVAKQRAAAAAAAAVYVREYAAVHSG